VISIIGPRPCYDPQHPQTRRQDAEAATRILALAQKTFGGVQSEGSLDFTAPALDRLLYVDCDKWLPLTKRPYVDTRVPLYQTVYHGVLLYSLSTDTVNCQPGEDTYLRSIEYGAVPLTYFYGHFLLDASKNWLGKSDYRYDDADGLKRIVTGLRRVYDDVQRLKHLQMEFLDGHRPLADQVFETSYSNGQRTVVNYREQPHTLPSGEIVLARNYLLIAPPTNRTFRPNQGSRAMRSWKAWIVAYILVWAGQGRNAAAPNDYAEQSLQHVWMTGFRAAAFSIFRPRTGSEPLRADEVMRRSRKR